MNGWYFCQENGRTLGPLTVDDIRERIRSERVGPYDLIYKEGEAGWRMAVEYPELRDHFRPLGGDRERGRPWVCLHRKSSTGFEFVTQGPYSQEEVTAALRAGTLSYADYVWRRDFPDWKRIGSVPEFNPQARPSPPPKAAPPSGEDLLANLVTMRRDSGPAEPPPPPEVADVDLTKIAVTGPSTEPEAETRIVTSRDADATRIVARPAEDPDATRIVARPASDPDATRVVSRASASSGPPPVPMAASPSAASDPEATVIAPNFSRPPVKKSRTRTKSSGSESSRRDAIRRIKFPKWTQVSSDWAIVVGLVVVLAVVIALISRRMSSRRADVPRSTQLEVLESGLGELAPPAESESGPRVVPPVDGTEPSSSRNGQPALESLPSAPEAETPPAAELPKTKARAPTKLTLKVRQVARRPTFEVRSNGSSEYPVYLQIIGVAGQVADGASFYRYVRIPTTGDSNAPLEIPNVVLPQGRFTVRAESGDLKKETELVMADSENALKTALFRARKVHSAAIWRERQQLFRLAEALESAVAKASEGHRLDGRGLEALSNVKKSSGGQFLFFDDWWELKDILREARAESDPNVMTRIRRQRERLASLSVWRAR